MTVESAIAWVIGWIIGEVIGLSAAQGQAKENGAEAGAKGVEPAEEQQRVHEPRLAGRQEEG